MRALPESFPRPERKVMWTILQLHFGDPHAHFELQPQPSRGLVELGLHFEGSAEANDAWAARVSAEAHAIAPELGPEWELEVWTASWRRLHRVWRTAEYTSMLATEVGAELARAMQTLAPMLIGREMPQ